MLTRNNHNSSAVRIAVLPQIPTQESSSSPSPPSTNSSGLSQGPSPSRSQPSTPTRPRSRASTLTRHRTPPNRIRAFSVGMSFNPNFTISAASSSSTPRPPPDPGSPPPYTPEPDPNSPFLAKRAVSSPHLHSPPQATSELYTYPNSHTSSRRPSSALHIHGHGPRHRPAYVRAETDEEEVSESTASADEGVMYRSPEPSLAGTLRERLFGKARSRNGEMGRVRSITTAPGVLGAGETETESEDAVSSASATYGCQWSFSLGSLSFARVTIIQSEGEAEVVETAFSQTTPARMTSSYYIPSARSDKLYESRLQCGPFASRCRSQEDARNSGFSATVTASRFHCKETC